MALPKIFKNINDQVSAVDPNGDTMKGAIRFNEGRGQLNAYSWDDGTTYVELYAKKNSDNKRTILQLNSAPDENGNSAIRLLFRDVNGTVTGLSNLYGEHFKPTASDVGALSLGGGTLTGGLEIRNTGPMFEMTNTTSGEDLRLYPVAGQVILLNRNVADDFSNYRALFLTNSNHTPSVKNSLFIQDCVSGKNTNYFVLHSGNYNSYALPLSGGYLTGPLTMKVNTGFAMEYEGGKNSPWMYPKDALGYGIRYFEGTPDRMTISASGNNETEALADLCINGNGEGTVTIRGNTILHTGNFASIVNWSTGNSGSGEHNCNNVTYNFCGYYTTNGPSTSIGATTNDGSLWTQAYSTSWITQLAQDYRNGNIFTRSRNNGTWTDWKMNYNTGNIACGTGSASIAIEKGIFIRY